MPPPRFEGRYKANDRFVWPCPDVGPLSSARVATAPRRISPQARCGDPPQVSAAGNCNHCGNFCITGPSGCSREEALPAARSEGHADAYAPPPNDAAFLSDLAVKKLEALGQIDHWKYFEAGAARGIVDQSAGNRRQLRAHDDLGLACLRSRGPNALIEPRELAFCHASMVPACCYRTLKVRWLKWLAGVDLALATRAGRRKRDSRLPGSTCFGMV